MKKVVYTIPFVLGVLLSALITTDGVNAQVCWQTRVINEHSCSGCTTIWRCNGDVSQSCSGDAQCGGYGGDCIPLCQETYDTEQSCIVLDRDVPCSDPPSCSWTGSVQECNVVGTSCTEPAVTKTYGCWGPGSTPTPDPGGGGDPTPDPDGCTVDLVPAISNLPQSSTLDLTANVTVTGGFVESVNFSSGNSSLVSVSPASDSSPSYETVATGESLGSTTVTADVIMSGSTQCTDNATINVVDPGPWWQVIDADVLSLGNLTSSISSLCSGGCSPLFDLDGPGGFPGLPIYSGSYDFGSGSTSSTNWLAEATFNDTRQYTYSYFDKKVPADATINEINGSLGDIPGSSIPSGSTDDGYYWYHYDGTAYGDMTISGDVSIDGDEKIILFVEAADLNIQGNISITSNGQGFLLVIVGEASDGTKGNINIDSSVTSLEGLFLADNSFQSGTAGADTDSQLYIRGSVAAYSGINLQRDLVDDTQTPAEVIEYAPELMLLFPKSLSLERMRWEEVAP